MSLDWQVLQALIDASPDGVVVCDANDHRWSVVYVNRAFEQLCGYSAAELRGRNLSFLQHGENEQEGLSALRGALNEGTSCRITLRNYRKDGSMFWNELNISPVRDAAGKLTHFIGVQKDVTEKVVLEQQLTDLTNTDALVGISNRRHFDQRFADLLIVAKRIHSGMSVLMIDLDYFKQFNDRYGHPAGDECLRTVGACIAKSFIRTSDCVARYGGEEFAVVSFSTSIETLRRHTQKLCNQVRELGIPYSDSPHGVVTVSIGGIHRLPNREATEEMFVGLAEQELLVAKGNGRNCISIIR